MAILNSLICMGNSRFLQQMYVTDINVSGTSTFAALSGTTITATTSLVSSGTLSVTGATTLTGAVTAGSTISATGNITSSANLYATGGYLYLAGKYVMDGGKTTANWVTINNGQFSGGTEIKGILKSATANITTANITTGTVNTLKSTNIEATNSITSPKWEIDSIANLGGTFMVAPTIYFSSTATVATGTITATTMPITITDTSSNSPFNGVTSEHKLAGTTWFQGAKVKFSGTINGVGFSSAEGVVSAQMTTSNKKIQLTITTSKAYNVLASNTNYTGAQIENIVVMQYQTPTSNNGSPLYPLGIYMSSFGDNRKSFIDIYSGTAAEGNPNVRIGLLNGLPNLPNGTTPTSWGIYTDNGFFKGTIYSQSGQIGGWDIGTNILKNGTLGVDGSVWLLTADRANADAKAIGGSSSALTTWRITAGDSFGVTKNGDLYCNSANISGVVNANTGQIGGSSGWTIASQQLSSGTLGSDASMYLATKDLSGTIAGASRTGLRLTVGQYFGVDKTGKLYSNSALIGGFTINSTSISNGTYGSDSSVFISTTNMASKAIAGTTLATWRLTVGSSFGVTNTGGVYANSGKIGGFTLSNNSFVGGTWGTENGVMLCTGTSTAKAIGGSGSISGWAFTAGANFGVTKTGALYANSANISGTVTATSGSIGGFTIGTNTLEKREMISDTDSFFYSTGFGNKTLTIDGTTEYIRMWAGWIDNDPSLLPPDEAGEEYVTDEEWRPFYVTKKGVLHATGGSILGNTEAGHVTINNNEFDMSYGNSSILKFSYGLGINESGGTSIAPYYTIGKRSSTNNTVGNYSCAIGYLTAASNYGSFAEGTRSFASGISSHAEGNGTKAQGHSSHAEGSGSKASGMGSHAEGLATVASGNYSHSEGETTYALGNQSHTQGFNTVATESYQTVIGKNNSANVSLDDGVYTFTNVGDYAFIIGNGTANTTAGRSNALTVDWNGNLWTAGNLTAANIGTTLATTGTSPATISAWTWTTLCSLSLTAGTYMIYGYVHDGPPNVNTLLRLITFENDTQTQRQVSLPGNLSFGANGSVAGICSTTQTRTIQLLVDNATAISGTSSPYNGAIIAVRIK